jgi:hypothetical protein
MGKHDERMQRHYVFELAELSCKGSVTISEQGMLNTYRFKDGNIELVKSVEQTFRRKRGAKRNDS